ncbi:putative tail fiber protein [Plesiomonas phage phiP4-7]|nr:putative tail fiber protein [Plesiomonas phage phiP4-7]
MPYRIKGTLKLPSGQPAAGVDIEFISRRNYSPLLMNLSSVIKTTSTGAYDITLEYGEYAVVVYWGCNQPSHIGKLFVLSDTAIGLDLQTLLQQSDWQPATPEYIQQIQDWLASANSLNNQAIQSAVAAKASENAVEADRAEVASNKTIVVNAQTDVSAKASDVTAKAAQVATNTATVNQKTPLAVAAADTASQKAVDAAASDASARDAATRAENAALAMTGAILDGGQCDLSSGFYPQPLTVNGKKYSTVWYVQVGGTVGGIAYDSGDKLQYTTANNGFYFRIDARDEVVSVNGKKGAVTLNAQDVGADQAGAASSLVDQHAQKVGAHAISGVAGLTEVLADKATKEEVSNAIDAHKAESHAHTPQNVGADPAGTASSLIAQHANKAGAHSIPGVSGLQDALDAKQEKIPQYETAVEFLKGVESKGIITFVRWGNIVTFKAMNNEPSNYANDDVLFTIPERFRPCTPMVGSEFPTTIGHTNGDNGRLILEADRIKAWQLAGSQWVFRASGSWIAG